MFAGCTRAEAGRQWRRRSRASCLARYWSLSPSVCKIPILTSRMLEIQAVSPIGEPSRVASDGSTTRAPGKAANIDALAEELLHITSTGSAQGQDLLPFA